MSNLLDSIAKIFIFLEQKQSYSVFFNFYTTLKLIFCLELRCYYGVKEMKNFFIIKLVLILVVVTGCETVKKKSDEIIKKENEKLSKFIGQPESELKIVMGSPDSETKDDKGNRLLIYKTKKYSISCVRKFEISEGNMVVGFTSKGCF